MTALTPVDGQRPGTAEHRAPCARPDTNYPDEIKALYLPLPDGSLGPNAQSSRRRSSTKPRRTRRSTSPSQLVKELQSSTYQYATDVRDLPCGGLSKAECFATYKKGFCQYYATTMAVILRDLGVPTRIAQGFLPGSRDQNAATETILFSNAHAWVEVYFPGYGWLTVRSDRRDCSQARAAAVRTTRPRARRRVRRAAQAPGRRRGSERDDPGGDRARPARSDRRGRRPGPARGRAGAAAAGRWRSSRSWSGSVARAAATTADDAYGTVTRIASRFGFGPRPNQTVYEYAGVLSDVLPIVRPELETVARAKVESVYAREILGDERIAEPQGGPAPATGQPVEAGIPAQGTPEEAARRHASAARQPAASVRERRSRLRSSRSANAFSSVEGREVRRQVVGAQDRATGTELDDA